MPLCVCIFICCSYSFMYDRDTQILYGIHHWRIFRSSFRKLVWVGFEPTTTEFRSDALSDWAIRPSVQLALRANFALYIWYKVYYSFDSQLPNNPKLFWLLLLYFFITAITFSAQSYIKQSIMSVRKGFSKKENSKKISVPCDVAGNSSYWPIWSQDTLLYAF